MLTAFGYIMIPMQLAMSFLQKGSGIFGCIYTKPTFIYSKVECANVKLPSHLRHFVHLNGVEEHLKETLKGLI